MTSPAQRVVDRVVDLRRALASTPQPDRVLAAIVASDDWAAIFRHCCDDQSVSARLLKSYLETGAAHGREPG
jgi:hypothetical protein